MKKKIIINGNYYDIHCYACNRRNMQSAHCSTNTNNKFEDTNPFMFTNELGFVIEFLYREKFYCFHIEPDCLNGPDVDDDYWDWWYEFDKYGNPAENSYEEGNLSFEIRGGYLGEQPAMINLEINVYHDGIYVQNEQVTNFNVLEISRKKCYA